MFQGDRSHFYDQLRDRFGFGVVKTVLVVYLLALICGGLGLAVSLLPPLMALPGRPLALALLAVTALLCGGFLQRGETQTAHLEIRRARASSAVCGSHLPRPRSH